MDAVRYWLSRCFQLSVAFILLSTAGCTDTSRPWWSSFPHEVEATLASLSVGEAVVVEPMGTRSVSAQGDDAAGYAGAEELFSVSLCGPQDAALAGYACDGEEASAADAGRAVSLPVTRADVALQNVWVLQFDAAGTTKACAWVGAVRAGQKVKARLLSGEGYTVWIVAGGPAEGGFTTSNPASLSDFESRLLYKSTPASDSEIPLSGKLTGVKVLDNGQVLVGDDDSILPEVTLTRTMARVDLLLEYSVEGVDFDGVWLYNVPVGTSYGLTPAAAGFPDAGDASFFSYTNKGVEGLVPQSSGSGTLTRTWRIGDNRRGQVPAIRWEKNKGENNAPAMATYARIKGHETANANKGLFHDVYLGENVTTDFDVKRNRHYIYRVRIGGTLDQQKMLAETDDRVTAGAVCYIDGMTVSPEADNIPGQGGTYSVTLTGVLPAAGVEVRAQSGGTALVTGKVTASGTAVSLAVPATASYSSRTVVFEYKWEGNWVSIASGVQGGLSVSSATVTPAGDIPGEGKTYSLTLTGTLPSAGVEVRANISGANSVTGKVTASGAAVSLVVPANASYSSRTVTFEYNWNGTWTRIGNSRTQQGYSVSNATHNAPTTIPGQGGTYSVTLTGVLPAAGVEVRANISGANPITGKATASGTPVELNIPANTTGAARTVVFEYKWNGAWTKIAERSQAMPLSVGDLYGGGVIYWINPDDASDFRVVALTDAPSTLAWAAKTSYVLGSGAQDESARNGADVWKIAKQYSDSKTGGASGTFATDFPAFNYCYEKTDGGVPRGTWYLPSKQELLDLYRAKGSVESVITSKGGSAFSTDNYWSTMEWGSGPSLASYVEMTYGGPATTWKTNVYAVRCIR